VKQSILALTVAVTLGGAGIDSAATQTFAADVVPPYEVFTIVRSMGLSPLGQPSLRGGVYVLRAGNRYGEQVRVLVDARVGQVVSIEPIAAGPDRHVEPGLRPPASIPGPRTGAYEQGPRVIPADPRYVPPRGEPRAAPPPAGYEWDDELDEEDDVGTLPPPRDPPRVITAPRFPDVPSARSAKVMPPKPPLPRPRPAATLASGEAAREVTGSVPTPPAKPAEVPTAKKPEEVTPPMQGFE
jgi:hypothetical protein